MGLEARLEATLAAILYEVVTMLTPRWCFSDYIGRCCGILVPKWCTRAARVDNWSEYKRLGGRNPCGQLRCACADPPLRIQPGIEDLDIGTPTRNSNFALEVQLWESEIRKFRVVVDDGLFGPSAAHYTRDSAMRDGGG